MSKIVRFQLDLRGGADVLQEMAMKQVTASANAVASRANTLVNSSSNPPVITSKSSVGVIKRGRRAIATVSGGGTARQSYLANEAIRKSIDAGRVS